MTQRCTRPQTPEEADLEQVVREVLKVWHWTEEQQTHLLDTLLVVHRFPETFTREGAHG